jgi:protein-tyrosine phosphatase
VISEDYLLTNRFYRRDPTVTTDLPDNVLQVIGTVRAAFLTTSFEAINTDYGGLDNYIRDGLGVGEAERAQLGGLYLERI